MTEKILILDFGSQYTQLIARRVRELNVYCEIHPFNHIPENTDDFIGVILSGSPCSVREEDAPDIDFSLFRNKMPLLGVCYGAQLMAKKFGGEVMPSDIREYGRAKLAKLPVQNELIEGINANSQVWMSHSDTIKKIPEGFEIIASTETVEVAAFRVVGEITCVIHFLPEVTHCEQGKLRIKIE